DLVTKSGTSRRQCVRSPGGRGGKTAGLKSMPRVGPGADCANRTWPRGNRARSGGRNRMTHRNKSVVHVLVMPGGGPVGASGCPRTMGARHVPLQSIDPCAARGVGAYRGARRHGRADRPSGVTEAIIQELRRLQGFGYITSATCERAERYVASHPEIFCHE